VFPIDKEAEKTEDVGGKVHFSCLSPKSQPEELHPKMQKTPDEGLDLARGNKKKHRRGSALNAREISQKRESLRLDIRPE
jgi:hypothetical protein